MSKKLFFCCCFKWKYLFPLTLESTKSDFTCLVIRKLKAGKPFTTLLLKNPSTFSAQPPPTSPPQKKGRSRRAKIAKQNHLTAANGYAISMGGMEELILLWPILQTNWHITLITPNNNKSTAHNEA